MRRALEPAMATPEGGPHIADPAAGPDDLFEGAPPAGVLRRLSPAKSGGSGIARRALLAALLGWAPLLLLSLLQGALWGSDDAGSFLREVGAHARYLVAVPLLVVAEAGCAPQLNAIVRQFVEGGIVAEGDRGRLAEAAASTSKLLRARAAEAVVIAMAYLIALATLLSHPLDQLPIWAASHGVAPAYSPAGWWHTLVSLPLLLALLLGWIWRIALWGRLLWLVSRLRLRLVASHPDRCAGLAFLGQSVRAFAVVALAIAVIVAGRSAATVLAGGGLPTPQLYSNIGLMAGLVMLLVAPLLSFVPVLLRTWQRGALEYGALAERAGQAFERKWLGQRARDEDMLEQPDFSSTTDLYQVVANVYSIRFVPVGLKDLAALIIAMLLPFVPVVLLAVPASVIWTYARSLLF